MAFLFLIGLLLVATSAGLLTRAIRFPRLRISSQIRQIETYGFHTGEQLPAGARSLVSRLNHVAEAVGQRVRGTGPFAPIEPRMLRTAGMYEISPEAFHGYRVLGAVGLPALLVLAFAVSGAKASTLMLPVAFGGMAWLAPQIVVQRRGQRRMDKIDRALPELVDVLIATVEAGLGFAGSLQLVADRFDGPLGQELRLTLQEQSMGLSTERALENMIERCDTPSLRSFARAVIQGESLGVSIGTMLRNLAVETRKRRRQAAREQIMKAPVKLLFPLVFLIFPALLVVLLYPAAVNLLQALGPH
jgi:tight adherence protein C